MGFKVGDQVVIVGPTTGAPGGTGAETELDDMSNLVMTNTWVSAMERFVGVQTEIVLVSEQGFYVKPLNIPYLDVFGFLPSWLSHDTNPPNVVGSTKGAFDAAMGIIT